MQLMKYPMPKNTSMEERRIQHAWALLKQKDKKITTIAKEAGFANHTELSIAFKGYYGIAPTKVKQAFMDADTLQQQLAWLSRRAVERLELEWADAS